MHGARPSYMILCALACVALACGGVSGSMPIPPAATGLAPAFASTSPSENHDLGVRSCLYDPAAPEPAPAFSVPAGTPTPYPTSTPPSQSAAEPQDVVRQTAVFTGFWNAVNEHYVDPGFNGKDWGAIGDRYQTMIEGGLSDEAFYALLQEMINELGDQHSYFQSPATVGEEEAALAGQLDFVGIGALLQDTTEGAAQVLLVFPTGPAAEAGLLSHDTILAVDGGPVRYENGASRTRGPEGTTVGLTVRSPGQGSREITLTRRRLTGGLPVDACMVPGTRLGYVMLPTFLDETIDDQMREALQSMTSEGPLDGLVLDMRMNGGGLGSVAQASLAVFLGGPQGAYVTREAREELVVEAEDVGGSQGVPLVVLVGPDTVSYGEIVRGILQLAGRATVVGQATLGNVEQLRRYDFEDGSRAWIASATFEPLGLPAGTWEDTGIVPEVLVPGRWDEFGEATDPGLAAAVEILRTR